MIEFQDLEGNWSDNTFEFYHPTDETANLIIADMQNQLKKLKAQLAKL